MRVRTITSMSTVLWVAIAAIIVAGQAAILPAADSSPPTTSNTSDGAPFIVLPAPRPVAAFSFTDRDGAPVTLADFQGRRMLLNLWAPWCAPCRKEMPALDRLQEKLGGAGFIVVPLSIDHRGHDAVARFYREFGLKSLSIYLDKTAKVTDAVNAAALPTTLLIDTQGREVGRVVGLAEWDSAAMLSRLKSYLEAHD